MNEDPKEQTSLDKSKAFLKETISWLIVFVSAIAIALFISRFVIFKAEVPTSSMVNTIEKDAHLLGFRIFGEIKRGDIVIFYPPDPENAGEYFVKRVIGLPGETVEVKNNVVYVDGVALDEPYIAEPMNKGDWGPYKIPAECYVMLGDNRNNSKDSREWNTRSHIAKEEIVAKVVFKLSPNFEIFKRPEY